MPELRRHLDRLETGQAARRCDTRNRMELAHDRMWAGIPNDEDIDLVLEDLSWTVPLAIEACCESTATRDLQRSDRPSYRLAADVFDADSEREVRQALAALRQLASDGRYEMSAGHLTARPDEIGMARVVLRYVVRTLEWQATQAAHLDPS